MEIKELIIIGGGPIGMACGIEAKRAGIDYLIFEKGTIVNSLFNYPLYMTFFSTAERLEIGNIPFTSIAVKPGRQEALEYYRKVQESEQLKIKLFCTVHAVEKVENVFQLQTDDGIYFARNLIFATGFFQQPYLMDIPGEELSKVRHYYKGPHEFSFRKVVVVGAQNSAVDAALQTFRKGAQVTMIVRGDEIGKRVKYWIRPDIINRIEEGSIRVFYHSELTEIKEHSVLVNTPKGIVELENDFVLAMTGYRPETEMLESLGIEFSRDTQRKPFYKEETMETNIDNLYLAGVICGGDNTHEWIIENSKIHAELIIRDLLSKR